MLSRWVTLTACLYAWPVCMTYQQAFGIAAVGAALSLVYTILGMHETLNRTLALRRTTRSRRVRYTPPATTRHLPSRSRVKVPCGCQAHDRTPSLLEETGGGAPLRVMM